MARARTAADRRGAGAHVRGRARRGTAVAAAGLLLAAGAACAPVEDGQGGAGGDGGDSQRRTLTVFAAASLTESFEELGERFEKQHSGTRVELNFAGSSQLSNQIGEGAPAGVFASANTHQMDLVVEDGRTAGEPVVFVRNTLQIAVPQDNPAGVESLSDLADPEVKVALCAEEVPCGAAAAEALDAGGVEVEPVSREQDVKAALTKAELGEVDAALVYRTDVQASGEVKGISFPEAEQAANDYPIAVLEDAPHPDLAQEWVDFVQSSEGDEVLDEAGFATV